MSELTKQQKIDKLFNALGREPDEDMADDLDRAFCEKAGQLGHRHCGWCDEHNQPRFRCGCYFIKEEK